MTPRPQGSVRVAHKLTQGHTGVNGPVTYDADNSVKGPGLVTAQRPRLAIEMR